jgi:hypothetical protein
MSFFGKMLAQATLAGVQILAKAFAQAYARAAAGGGREAASAVRSAVAGRMPADQARAVLNLGEKGSYSPADVAAQFEKYFKANDADGGGSFYLQSKVHNAREALLEELKEPPPPPADGAKKRKEGPLA